MQIKTFKANSVSEIQGQIKSVYSEKFQPNLAIVFCSVHFDIEEVSKLFNEMGIEAVGASTAGEILNDTMYEGIVTGLLLEVDRSTYKIFNQEYEGCNPFSACKRAGEMILSHFTNPAIIVMSGGVSIDAEQIVFGLKAGVKEETPIFGGLAADDLQLKETFAFTHKGVTSNGVVLLAFDNDKIELRGMATSGWEGVGTENVITHAEGNMVYSINGEPAVNAFIKYFGYFNNVETEVKVSEISAQYPLQIMREDGTAILRAPLMSIEDSGALMLAGGVRNGDRFKFSIAPGFEVIDKTIEEFDEWRQEVEKADALILFSCKGRHAALGPLIEDEITGIYNFWKKPMVGFFTYGEIGNLKNGDCDFHNETCSLVVLRERS